MLRPCFLVVDREFSSGISSRKLIIETAKFNVITAYSAQEALDALAKFPAVDGAVLDEHNEGYECADLVLQLKAIKPSLPVIAVGLADCPPADFHVEAFSPAKLLEVLQRLQPAATAAIEKMTEVLNEQESKLPEAERMDPKLPG